jgi:hypothetical protein
VLAGELDGSSLFEALRSRRTFGATTKGLFIDLRVDDAVMGEEIVASDAPRVHVSVLAPAELAEVVVFRNGRPWRAVGREIGGRSEVVGATVELDAPFDAKGPVGPWTLALTAEDGTWIDADGRRRANARRGGFAIDGTTATFTWPAGFTGFRPSELRVRLRARRDATLTIECDGDRRSVRVAALLARGARGRGGDGAWSLTAYERYDELVDLAKGLGVHRLDQEWIDEEPVESATWYYARAVQTDGEMAWSSPIWVAPAPR